MVFCQDKEMLEFTVVLKHSIVTAITTKITVIIPAINEYLYEVKVFYNDPLI